MTAPARTFGLALAATLAFAGWACGYAPLAVARTPLAPDGQVAIRGELWQAALRGPTSLPAGASVIVRSVEGLTLIVEPVETAKDSLPS